MLPFDLSFDEIAPVVRPDAVAWRKIFIRARAHGSRRSGRPSPSTANAIAP
jgi:hypothetical protein